MMTDIINIIDRHILDHAPAKGKNGTVEVNESKDDSILKAKAPSVL